MDMAKVVPLDQLVGEDDEETKELHYLARCARDFLTAFDWCAGVREMYSGIAIARVIGVFLTHIDAKGEGVDEWLWVIVGDLPSAYLVTDDATNPLEALRLYIDLMREWVEAVREGLSVDDLIPVGAEPSTELADMLDSRLRFLSERVVPEYSDES